MKYQIKELVDPKTYQPQIPLILFSGGLDSTHLLSERLKTSDVDVLYVKGPQGPDKIEMELDAREKIEKWLAKNRPFKIRYEYIHNDDMNHCPNDHKFGQVLSWFNAALNVSDSNIHSVVEIAYVAGDSICSDLHWVKNAWDNLAYVVKNKAVGLSFPLEYVTKKDIIKEMHPHLYKLIWVCELPIKKVKYFKVCGGCTACITHAAELFKIERLTAIAERDSKRLGGLVKEKS